MEEDQGSGWFEWRYLPVWEAGCAGGGLAGALDRHPAWQCLYWVVVGVQFAAMLMGAACVGRWILAGWRAAEKASPDSTDCATG
ncbi:hypothetical protein EAS64_37730 [Trebonia kvetii]|uniref:Uncharacterized protein n=1 Tax=Trebonia kvetii TaxID=2480626 RepID=A0A6P2BNA0_9ACTN|nr:hypothetical protein [Trebonia kvetii]TVZ00378.1 hypothetical protein EAS64_37730 [Trebonia kvetii]